MRGWSAQTHWAGSPDGAYAIDWYAGPLGLECGWIVSGRTRGVAMMGPLEEGGHDCPFDSAELQALGTALYTVILDSDDGETMFAFTHVLKQARLNTHVEKYEKFFQVGDSGLEPFTERGQNPAHIHLAIMRDRSQFGRWQGGRGNVRVWDWLRQNNFMIRDEGWVPSPQWYMDGNKNIRPYNIEVS